MNNYLINIDELVETNRAFGGNAGAKIGVIFNNEEWIVKYPKNLREFKNIELSYSTGPLSEFIGSHIYEILGFPVHKTLLGHDKEKLVVLCKNFNLDNKLIEFKNIANRLRSTEMDFLSYTDGTSTDLNKIIETIKLSKLIKNKEKAINHFWDMFVIDYLINNNDRNNTNWGFMIDPLNINTKEELAPVYDCGNSFNNKLKDDEMEKKMSEYESFKYFAVDTLSSCFLINGHHLNFSKAFENTDVLSLGLKDAVLRNVPKINEKKEEIINFVMNIPEDENGIAICSDIKKEFLLKTMIIRLNKVLIPTYESLKETEKKQKLKDDYVME